MVESLTTNVATACPESPSVIVTSVIDSDGAASSSVMVPSAWLSEMLALIAFDKFSKNVSLASSKTSPLIGTVIVFEVAPAAIVRTPEVVA